VKPVRFTPLASREVDLAAAFYEGRKDGLGAEFYERVDEAVNRIRENPEGYQKVYKSLRRCNLVQFPYALLFQVGPDNSLVIGCLHGHRKPEVARERAAGVTEIPKGPEPS
jgi:toxin ParE1/3/4